RQELNGLRMYADLRRLKQILVNLLTNAVKFTPEHGEVILYVQADTEQDRVQFSVSDNGIGIDPQDLQKLFRPFVQVDTRLNREKEGTGLGLALVRKLTDLHGGSVDVESAVGKGSRFTIKLPWGRNIIAQHEAALARKPEAVSQQAAVSTVTPEKLPDCGKVLLAEDNMANILTMGEYLETH